MNYFKILEGLTKLVKSGQIKSVDEALAMLQRGGAKIDGILRQGVVNIFKKGKARDPDFGTNVTKMPVDDAGVPFNPNTLKSTTEKRGVENLFKKADLPEGVDYKNTPLPVNPKVENFYDELVENAYNEAKKTGRDVKTIIEETIDYKFTGNETGKEILDIIEKKFFKADGGRIGFNQGGNLGLNEQAQNIYDSWISAGHSEADTLAYLESRGMYNTPVKQQGIMTAPNIINKKLRDDGGDDTGNIITPYDPNINLGPNKDVFDYEADAYGIGPTFRGQFARLKNAYSKIPTPFNIVKMGIQKAQDFADQRRKEKEREAAAATEALQAQITAQANITARDLVARGASPDFGKTETRSSSGWENSPFAKGGVATMFKRKR